MSLIDNITNMVSQFIIDKIGKIKKEEEKCELLKIITEHEKYAFDPGHTHRYGVSVLMEAIYHNHSDIALSLIKTSKSKPFQKAEHYNNTALILSCCSKLPEVALALIATGESDPSTVNTHGNTALMLACKENMSEVALALIATGKSNPSIVNKEHTAMSYAIKNKMSDVILALLASGELNDSISNELQYQTIEFACEHKIKDIILMIVDNVKCLNLKIFEPIAKTDISDDFNKDIMNRINKRMKNILMPFGEAKSTPAAGGAGAKTTDVVRTEDDKEEDIKNIISISEKDINTEVDRRVKEILKTKMEEEINRRVTDKLRIYS